MYRVLSQIPKLAVALLFAMSLSGCTISGPYQPASRKDDESSRKQAVTVTTEKQEYGGGTYVEATAYNGLSTPIIFSGCDGPIPILEYQDGSTWIAKNSAICPEDLSPRAAPRVVQPRESIRLGIPLTRSVLQIGTYRLRANYHEVSDTLTHAAYSNTFQMVSAVPKEPNPTLTLSAARIATGELITLNVRNTTPSTFSLMNCNPSVSRRILLAVWQDTSEQQNGARAEEYKHEERCRGIIEENPTAPVRPDESRNIQLTINEPGRYRISLPVSPALFSNMLTAWFEVY